MKAQNYHSPTVRFIIDDGKGSNKLCHFNTEVDTWLHDCGLVEVSRKTVYTQAFTTIYVYVTNK
jgi:hypothetical protein